MATKLEIYNSCFIKLGGEPVTAITDSNKRNNLLNAIYDTVKSRELRQHPWNFAIKRTRLLPDTVTPTWKWGSAFKLPADYIKIKEVRHDYLYAIENNLLVIEDTLVATDVSGLIEEGSTTTVINATAHSVLVGDIVETGGEKRVVGAVTTDTFTLLEALTVSPRSFVTNTSIANGSNTTLIRIDAHPFLIGERITIGTEVRTVLSYINANSFRCTPALPSNPPNGTVVSLFQPYTTERASEVYVEYIANVDEADFTPDFAEVLAYILAAEICYALVQNRELSNQILEKAELAKRLARSMDAQEGTPIELMDDHYLNVRL